MSDNMNNKDAQYRVFTEINNFLKDLNWPAESLSSKVVRTFYQGEYGLCEVIIYVGQQDICMVIDPLVEKNSGAWGDSVRCLINTMAEEIKHIGIGLDDDGDLFVKVHLPVEHLNKEHFHCLLLGMCQVAQNIMLPIMQANAFDNLKAA